MRHKLQLETLMHLEAQIVNAVLGLVKDFQAAIGRQIILH
jgi:hypothetical protein